MENATIAPGSLVRYPRTGTSGKATGSKIIDGREFVLIDSTGMYYRADQLIIVDSVTEKRERGEEKGIERFKAEKKLSSEDIRDAFDDVTGVGAG
ncbi:DUF2098 domain-containing protein [Methanolacinia paynteri]|uniref:DUF2098 domain-containing protein n=1 Tax=Methanolacinia paynteri TaxID=230356 RepID=UPI00064FAF90|nr:DUF2098 domain-containing protein [Methanolacinia paynteri]